MKLIRNNIFETNSSSTHCIVLVSKDDYKKFEDGEMYLDFDHDRLIDLKTAERYEKESIFVNTRLNFDWDNKMVTYQNQTVPYDDYRKIFLTDENLNSITDEDIKKYREDRDYCDTDLPMTSDDFDKYIEECNYYPYKEVNDDLNAVAFGYYGNDY